MAAGDQILIVDGGEADREGLRTLFANDGYMVSAVADSVSARELVDQTFFHAVLVDLDVEPDGGPAVARYVRDKSAQTGILMLSNRRSFDGAVDSFRAGALDFIIKRPDAIPFVKQQVERAADRIRYTSNAAPIVKMAKDVLDELLKRLMDVAKRVPSTASMLATAPSGPVQCLIVDTDEALARAVADAVKDEVKIELAPSGGAALDRAGQVKFEIVAVKADLPDLPGSMVVRQLSTQAKDVEAILFQGPGPGGRMERYQSGVARDVWRPFDTPKQMADKIRMLADSVRAVRQERMFLGRFREEHIDFLRKYAELKMKLDAMG
jgi:DNA-binding NtrC family response regulator